MEIVSGNLYIHFQTQPEAAAGNETIKALWQESNLQQPAITQAFLQQFTHIPHITYRNIHELGLQLQPLVVAQLVRTPAASETQAACSIPARGTMVVFFTTAPDQV